MAYTYSQLEQFWTEGGGAPALAPVMAAIALAESSGNPSAIGPGGSWGLWQIQPQDWPQYAQTTDPVTQASDANAIYRIQGLSAWSTYTGGEYRKYLQSGTYTPPQQASAPTATTPSTGGTAPTQTQTGQLTTQASLCAFSVLGLCMDTPLGLVAIAAGGGLLIVCVILMV